MSGPCRSSPLALSAFTCRHSLRSENRRLPLVFSLWLLLLIACSHAATPQRRPSPRISYGITVSFDTPAAIVAFADTSHDSTRHTVEQVLSIGGIVVGSRGDSLVIVPNLIVQSSESSSEKPRLITTQERGLPPLVIVKVTTGVHLSDFGWRTRTRASDQVDRLIHLGLVVFLTVALGGILFGPHR